MVPSSKGAASSKALLLHAPLPGAFASGDLAPSTKYGGVAYVSSYLVGVCRLDAGDCMERGRGKREMSVSSSSYIGKAALVNTVHEAESDMKEAGRG